MVVQDIVFSVSDYVTTKGLKLIFRSDIEEKIMTFDEDKIERIMLNLISNAIKFSPIGENIYVDIFDRGNHVCIKVKDMGIGIPPDRMLDIFKRFYQISPVNTRLREGSGIGLSIVKSLVEMHQGSISVESEYGKGTSFLIELPATLLPEIADKEELKVRQERIENIRLEFSDIYLANE
jgi:signal transduction histidine kinase